MTRRRALFPTTCIVYFIYWRRFFSDRLYCVLQHRREYSRNVFPIQIVDITRLQSNKRSAIETRKLQSIAEKPFGNAGILSFDLPLFCCMYRIHFPGQSAWCINYQTDLEFVSSSRATGDNELSKDWRNHQLGPTYTFYHPASFST